MAKITERDREEFAEFCRNATAAQLEAIADKERRAGRLIYARIAETESARR